MTGHLDLIYAEKLRRLRAERHDKQEAIAMDLGISQRDYSDLENGRVHFTEDMIRKICLTFRVTPASFRKIENSPALSSFITALSEQGLVDDGREKVAKDLEILMYKKTIKELQYEKTKLQWELNRTQSLMNKPAGRGCAGIYVMI